MQFVTWLVVAAMTLSAASFAQTPFDEVHPVFRTHCSDCHDFQGNGNLHIASGNIFTAYASSQLPSYFAQGQTKGFAALVRIQNGDMPLGAGCTGNPPLDVGNASCLSATEMSLVLAWMVDGQAGPLPTTGTGFCFGDGSGTPCPCANNGAADGGCASSVNFSGGKLEAGGVSSLTNDTLVLRASRMPNGSALFFQANARIAGGNGQVFGDGLRCVAGSVTRFSPKINFAGASQYPEPGDSAISVQGAIPALGGTRHYQVWYRNAGAYCQPDTFNLTNAVTITWGP